MTTTISSRPDERENGPISADLNFLWLELTNRCNLQCVHCYTESSPDSGSRDILTREDYLSVMHQAYALGCRNLQFIGGEPQLNPDFQSLLEASKAIGFEFVEVFTNLTMLAEETVQFARDAKIHFATSVYSDDPEAHRAVTRNKASHGRTVRNLERLIDNGIFTRAAVIHIDQTTAEIERTKQFLLDLGVRRVRSSRTRAFGRGEELIAQPTQMSELCGHCWAGRLCVAPDGEVYPCVMARQWPVGNVCDTALADIVHGIALRETRTTIHRTAWLPKLATGEAMDGHAGEYEDTEPPAKEACPQSCTPSECPQSCVPNCDPDDGCLPFEHREKEQPPAPEPACPQSCHPSECPQSCTPTCDPADGCLPQEHPEVEEPIKDPQPACPQSCDPSGCPQSCTPTCDPADGCLPQEEPPVQ